ncbi:MAG: undecaprenyl phosphate translocase family protein [[Clostridium] leptum]
MEKDSVKSVSSILRVLFRVIQGAVIGLGAVLPGISGGVLCVVFGIYKPIMESFIRLKF